MSADASSPKIGEGRDGRGSHLTPPEPGCGCTVQTPVQPSASQKACTTVTVVGARGGAGTSTIAAVLALTGRTMVRTELVAHEPDITAALIGAGLPDELPGEIVPNLTLATEPTGGAGLCIVDAGTLTKTTDRPSGPGERRIGVVRGPCYLALRTLLVDDYGLDGIVLLSEPGRSLTRRDVTDVTGLEIVATVPVTASVARSIDAGLLASRLDRMSEFGHLRRWLTGLLDPFPPPPSRPETTAPSEHQMSGTDLLLALCASSRRWEIVSRRAGSTRLPSVWNRIVPGSWRVEHRQAQPRGRGILCGRNRHVG
jgi:hypothetical protein